MDLHGANLAAATDATPEERVVLIMRLQEQLKRVGSISESDAQTLLRTMRGQ